MHKIITLSLIASLLVGCITSTPVQLPNGKSGYEIGCGGKWGSWSGCMNRASELCNGSYSIADRTQEDGVFISGNTAYQTVSRKIMVVCE